MPHNFTAFIGFYPTRDLQATHDFYVNVLGLRLARDQGTCHIYEVTGGGYIGFCQRNEAELPRNIVLTLVLDDVDEVYKTLQAAGVECEDAPKLNEQYGIYHFYAKGPMGERVEVQRFENNL